MFGWIYKLSLFLALSIALFVANAHAQTYAAIGYGSKYLCGYMPAGENQLYAAKGSRNVAVSIKKAIASVNNEIVKFELRIQRLNRVRYSLRDKKLTSSEIRIFNKIAASNTAGAKKLPRAYSERVKAVKRALSEVKASIKNKKREIASITNCGKESAASSPTTKALAYEQVKFKGLDGFYVSTVMYLPRQPATSFWYCIKGPWQDEGEPRLFSRNPCFSGWPTVRNNDCSEVTPSNMYTSIYTSRLFFGPGWEASNPYVVAAVSELEKFYAGNIIGRPRTSMNDDCKVIR